MGEQLQAVNNVISRSKESKSDTKPNITVFPDYKTINTFSNYKK